MPQFFVDPYSVKGRRAILSGEEAHHVRAAMRKKRGDSIRLFDGLGRGFTGRIREVKIGKVEVDIESEFSENREAPVALTLVPGLLPHEAMDWLIEKATELGVVKIIPLRSERSVARVKTGKLHEKKSHWEKVALSACKQCGRLRLPEIGEPLDVKDAGPLIRKADLSIFGDLSPKTQVLPSVLGSCRGVQSAVIFSGPEGGFSEKEAEDLRRLGALPVSLGPRTLRSETAALFCLSILDYFFNQI